MISVIKFTNVQIHGPNDKKNFTTYILQNLPLGIQLLHLHCKLCLCLGKLDLLRSDDFNIRNGAIPWRICDFLFHGNSNACSVTVNEIFVNQTKRQTFYFQNEGRYQKEHNRSRTVRMIVGEFFLIKAFRKHMTTFTQI